MCKFLFILYIKGKRIIHEFKTINDDVLKLKILGKDIELGRYFQSYNTPRNYLMNHLDHFLPAIAWRQSIIFIFYFIILSDLG